MFNKLKRWWLTLQIEWLDVQIDTLLRDQVFASDEGDVQTVLILERKVWELDAIRSTYCRRRRAISQPT